MKSINRLFGGCFAAVWLIGAGMPAAQAEQRVYLLARVSVDQTTWTESALFYDRDADDIAKCEQDIVRGQLGQWQYYGHMVRKRKGVASTISYACVVTDLEVDPWQAGYRYSYVYRIDRHDHALTVTPYTTYADCVATLGKKETNTYYCTKSNQQITASAN